MTFDSELWSIETEPVKIAFCGDWHGNRWWAADVVRYVREQGADTILHAGDFGYNFNSDYLRDLRYALEEHKVTLYWVDGNHDNHKKVWNGWELRETGFMVPPFGRFRERINYIPRGHRWQWWGLTFMGLGGAHSVDRPYRTPELSWWETERITDADIARATRGGKVDVMITHDIFESAPFPLGDENRLRSDWFAYEELVASQQSRQALQAVVDVVNPRLFVHGHYHIRKSAEARNAQGARILVESLAQDATSYQDNVWFLNKIDLVEE